MNPILAKILEDRKGHYVHAMEIVDDYELQSNIDQLIDEFSKDYTKETIIDFFNTMQIYCISEDDTDHTKVDRFNIERYIEYIMG
jgi:hypothetical protein